MFGFVKQIFIIAMFFGCNLSIVNPWKFISMNNQECKVRPQILNNSDEPVLFSFSIKRSKCNCSYNNINDHYEKWCVPDVVKNLNARDFI